MTIALASTDPFVQPLIDPNMLTEDIDILIMMEAVRAAQQLLQAPAWKDYINSPYADSANLTSDAALKAYIRSFASSFNHAAGTAKISHARENGGVVGPDLKVKGAAGLRIVDASILVRVFLLQVSRSDLSHQYISQPFAFGAHFQAVVYAIAERAADLIKAA
ncbi:hypothetical protein C0992_000595 [Termitomyces sp. T32_za158]|nr:hypothetical protein C0992_000595 [Termitomyces sp. T32_za158]